MTPPVPRAGLRSLTCQHRHGWPELRPSGRGWYCSDCGDFALVESHPPPKISGSS